MAVGAVAAQPYLCGKRLPVAGLAFDACVCTFENERRLRVMIEDSLLPIDRVVTDGAPFAEVAAMDIGLVVTFDALLRGIAENVRLVAILALTFLVLPEERKARKSMIEEDVVLPGRFVVTIQACRAERAVMRIAVFVA